MRAVPPQVPAALQLSTAVQNCPSSHAVPAARGVYVVVDAAGLQARQAFFGETVPAAMQALPMMQPPESALTQAFVVSLQVSAVHVSVSAQLRAVPPHLAAASQVSTAVQYCPSSHAVPVGRAEYAVARRCADMRGCVRGVDGALCHACAAMKQPLITVAQVLGSHRIASCCRHRRPRCPRAHRCRRLASRRHVEVMVQEFPMEKSV